MPPRRCELHQGMPPRSKFVNLRMVFDAAVVVLYAVIADPQDADAKIGVANTAAKDVAAITARIEYEPNDLSRRVLKTLPCYASCDNPRSPYLGATRLGRRRRSTMPEHMPRRKKKRRPEGRLMRVTNTQALNILGRGRKRFTVFLIRIRLLCYFRL
jgi:hypothetical protein